MQRWLTTSSTCFTKDEVWYFLSSNKMEWSLDEWLHCIFLLEVCNWRSSRQAETTGRIVVILCMLTMFFVSRNIPPEEQCSFESLFCRHCWDWIDLMLLCCASSLIQQDITQDQSCMGRNRERLKLHDLGNCCLKMFKKLHQILRWCEFSHFSARQDGAACSFAELPWADCCPDLGDLG